MRKYSKRGINEFFSSLSSNQFNKKLLLTLFLLSILLFNGCSGSSSSSAANFKQYVGNDGLTISFMKDTPPASVYENRWFPVSLEVANKGAVDVNYSDMKITFLYDPLYISGGISPYDPRTGDQQSSGIRGKSLGFRDGETKSFVMPSEAQFSTKAVFGQRQVPDTELSASVCYKYNTYLASSVCIDANTYGQNVRKQSCTQKDLSFSGGQGAPIAITSIKVRSIPMYDGNSKTASVRPEFFIEMQDVGQGYLIGPGDLELNSACVLKSISRDLQQSVRVEAWMLNTKLDCGIAPAAAGSGSSATSVASGLAKFSDGKSDITCTVPQDKMTSAIYATSQNFETSIVINLSYLYKTTTKQKITITRTPGNVNSIPLWMYGKRTGLMYMSDIISGSLPAIYHPGPTPVVEQGTSADASGNAPKLETPIYDENDQQVTKCDFFAANSAMAPTAAKQITKGYACGCSQQRCNDISPKGQCIYGFCPGETYCCVNGDLQKYSGGIVFTGNIQTGDPTVAAAINNINKFDGLMGAIFDAANKEGVDPRLMIALITQESAGRATAISNPKKDDGTGGAAGISQFMYNTARSPPYAEIFGDGVRICIRGASSPEAGNCVGDPRFDPYKSVRAQAKYLSSSMHLYNNDPKFTLASYNCGPTCASNLYRTSNDWDAISSKAPGETQGYVTKIMGYYNSIQVS